MFKSDKNNLLKLDGHFLYLDPEEGRRVDTISSWKMCYSVDDTIELTSAADDDIVYTIHLENYDKIENIGVTQIDNKIFIIERVLNYYSYEYAKIPENALLAIPEDKRDDAFLADIYELTMPDMEQAELVNRYCRKYDLSYRVTDQF